MATVNAAQAQVKTVADPNAEYDSLKTLWTVSRAVCQGQRFVKDYDAVIDVVNFNNLLIPFSPSMSPEQYKFYKAEAELPGIVAQFSKTLVGGLLRKQPSLTLPEEVESSRDWIVNEFSSSNAPLSAFLEEALMEEVQTTRAWVFVNYPKIENPEALSTKDFLKYAPYPVLAKAETVINWRVGNGSDGKVQLQQVIIKGHTEEYIGEDFHPTYKETVWVHELVDSRYQIRVFKKNAASAIVPVTQGYIHVPTSRNDPSYVLDDTITSIMMNGKHLDRIPAWPLNGNITPVQPMLVNIIDREISLYNKISRRNHLLYGAATYTPIISSDMTDDDFRDVVNQGLGSWIHLRQDDTASILKTPTEALKDMESAIASGIEEMAKLGIRMLSPETSQSGVALELRSAPQAAQLGSMDSKVSNTMEHVIAFMINWRYDKNLTASDIDLKLSNDFNASVAGEGWLRLATEWYMEGLIPRSIWLELLKGNDVIQSDYNDEEGQKEIMANMQAILGPNPLQDNEEQRASADIEANR